MDEKAIITVYHMGEGKNKQRNVDSMNEHERTSGNKRKVGVERTTAVGVMAGSYRIWEKSENSTHGRNDASVFAPIFRLCAIVPLDERCRNRARAVRRLTRGRGQRVAGRHRGCALRRADAGDVRQIRIAPDPARKIVQRSLHRLRD
jgi:hypothetical protein